MIKSDAYELLMAEFASYRDLQYEELVQFIGQSSSRMVRARDSTVYVVDVGVYWFQREHKAVIVTGTVSECTNRLSRIDEHFVVWPPSQHSDT